MKELNNSELFHILGGKKVYDCRDFLQEAAAMHIKSSIPEEEEAYWDAWNDQYDLCLKSLGITN